MTEAIHSERNRGSRSGANAELLEGAGIERDEGWELSVISLPEFRLEKEERRGTASLGCATPATRTGKFRQSELRRHNESLSRNLCGQAEYRRIQRLRAAPERGKATCGTGAAFQDVE